MKDHEIATLVNKLRDIAILYNAHQSLRCRISNEIIEALAVKSLPYMGKPALTASEVIRKNRKAPYAVGKGTKTTSAMIPPDWTE